MIYDNALRRIWQRFYAPIDQRMRIDGEAFISVQTGQVVDGQPTQTGHQDAPQPIGKGLRVLPGDDS